MTEPLDYAINLALQTGELLQNYYSPTGIHSTAKADNTVVTQADLAADSFISRQIKQQFPGDGILSEESSHFLKDPKLTTWVIDPLDGTTNFSLGLAIWGVSIARMVNGFPELGVIYFPRLNELYSAKRGEGAHLNGEPTIVRTPDPTQPNSFFACCSRSFRTFNISIPYKPRILGSSTYTISMVARGLALLALDATPKIWDLAAAWLIVEESGGMMSVYDGPQPFPLSLDLDYSTMSYTVLSAATPNLLQMAHRMIQRK